MGSKYLIDSNVVIDYLAGNLSKRGASLVRVAVNEIPTISVVTKIEVLSFKIPLRDGKLLTSFVEESVVIGLSDEIVEATIQLRKQARISTPDAIIAATAVIYELTLLTRNEQDFRSIKNLKILNPWKR
ncbi:MAG: type II toxin-antitoxin system VapC family toxin [Cyclobacteriaceae bacterium]